MQNVESKLELLSHSMKQLDLDIQLSVNKQDKHKEQLNTSLRDLESQVNKLASRQAPEAPQQQQQQYPATPTQNSWSANESPSTNYQPPSPTTPSNPNSSQATCPVCSQTFSAAEIHLHIEGHFAEGSSSSQQQQQQQEQEPGFWGKLFKKKETPGSSPTAQTVIQPPTYNVAPSVPPNAIPAFYSPSGTVQYIPQPNTQSQTQYSGYPMSQ